MGGAPELGDINIQTDESDNTRLLINRLLLLQRKDRVADGAYYFVVFRGDLRFLFSAACPSGRSSCPDVRLGEKGKN